MIIQVKKSLEMNEQVVFWVKCCNFQKSLLSLHHLVVKIALSCRYPERTASTIFTPNVLSLVLTYYRKEAK